MPRLSDFKILTKLSGVIAIIAFIVGGCIWYAQGRMTYIDEAYTTFVNHEAEAASTARRINRLIFELNYWVYRVIAETGCRQIHLAAHRSCTDASVANNRSIYYGGCLYPPEDRFQVIDRDYIGGMVGRLGEK